MNAYGNPIGAAGGVQREQTMEEILASIRKIIESNEAITGPSSSDLDEAETANREIAADFEPEMVAAPVVQPIHVQPVQVQPVQGQPVHVQPVQIDVLAALTPIVDERTPSLQSEMARLVSQSPERRVAAAFDDLNSAFAKTKQFQVEDVAEAMLRPMLKDWLDNNLPNLVERLVREEISRIARGDI